MEETFEWNVVNEGQLLDAMMGHKPVGINKYFQMAFIYDKLTENIKKDVQSTKIWAHLRTMYNLEALDETEALPFPNDEREFNLPESEYGPLKQKIEEKSEEAKKLQKGRETPKIKEIKKEEVKTPIRNPPKEKETPRRDSKDRESKEVKLPVVKKEIKKEPEKPKVVKGRNSVQGVKEEAKNNKKEESPRPAKRPTRGSLKPEGEINNGGKASPVTVAQVGVKRRRI